MKMLARGFIWWPNMDSDLESVVKQCRVCLLNRNAPALAPVHSVPWPEAPWSSLHLDFAGPVMGKMLLIIIDSHSKWIEAHIMSSCTPQATIDQLRSIFATFGLPKLLVSDNGPSFTSLEFKKFVTQNGIVHRTTAPYHPASNGQAERAVQVIKQGLKKLEGSLETRLSRLLFSYRSTHQTTTGLLPAELLFGRPLRTRLDLVFPDVSRRVQKRQIRNEVRNSSRSTRTFEADDPVLCRGFSHNKGKWLPASVHRKTGPVSYGVSLSDGRIVRRHVDQLISRAPELTSDVFDRNPPLHHSNSPARVHQSPSVLRRSTRTRNPPDRFNPCQ